MSSRRREPAVAVDPNPVLSGEQLEALADELAPPRPASHRVRITQTVSRTGGRHTYVRVLNGTDRELELLHVSKDGSVTLVDQETAP